MISVGTERRRSGLGARSDDPEEGSHDQERSVDEEEEAVMRQGQIVVSGPRDGEQVAGRATRT